ncbi:MAG: hypothetical protein WAP52_00060, partial [Candidatus Sungiibacteriota bacterium]
FLVYGVPIHNFRLWRLERNFREVASYHPSESRLIEREKYLGGPSEHGSLQCDFFVGEFRTAPLSKESIRQAYEGHSIRSINHMSRIPLKVLFFDEGVWTMDSPLGGWWDEWYLGGRATTTRGTAYFVFASQEGYPFLGDRRCDD